MNTALDPVTERSLDYIHRDLHNLRILADLAVQAVPDNIDLANLRQLIQDAKTLALTILRT